MASFSRSTIPLDRAVRPVIEELENRQLLSAALTLSSSLLVFNAVADSAPSPTQTLTLTNTGDAPLTLGQSAFIQSSDSYSPILDYNRFTLVNIASVPSALAPGASFGLKIDFNANSDVNRGVLLSISTNDPVHPIQQTDLHGIGTWDVGLGNQPSLATILQAYNIPTLVGEGVNDADAEDDSIYPNPPDPSSQEVPLQRLEKATHGPVTIDVLASFTSSGFSKSYILGSYTPGDATGLNELFYTSASENQTTSVHPIGSTSFDPGNSQFGFYFVSNEQATGRIGYSEDALNTWDTTNPRKFRFFPMENPDGSIVANSYIMTTTEWSDPSGYEFTNLVAIVSNVKAAPAAPTGPVLGLQNLNAVPGSSTMVFNRIQSPNTSVGDHVHNSGILQVTNTGGSPLIISSYTLTSGYSLVSAPSFPVTVAPSGVLDLTIKFNVSGEPAVPYNETSSPLYPTGGGVYDGTLTLHTNDTNDPTATESLAGWYQYHSENSNEPSLQSIVNLLYGWSTDINPSPIPDLLESTTNGAPPTYYGEEVVSAYWAEADPNQSVTVQQIAAYHGEGQTTTTYWFPNGGSSNPIFTTASDDGQTLFPFASGTSAPAIGSFSTNSTFGFRVDSEYSDDSLNALQAASGHHFRFYPVRTAAGLLIPNDYIMTMDYGNVPQNFDFQDNVWLVSNIRPVTVVSVTTPQTSAAPPSVTDFNATVGTTGNVLQWAPSSDANLAGYKIYRSSSLTGTYALLTANPITATSYIDSNAPSGGTSYYEVMAYDSVLATQSLPTLSSIQNSVGNGTTGLGAPLAAPFTVSTVINTAVTINDFPSATDNESAIVLASTVAVTTQPAHGTVSVNTSNGAITYTPATGFSGTDIFQYTVSDSTQVSSSPASITVTVIAGTPVAANLSKTTTENTALAINAAGSANDSTGTIIPTSVNLSLAPGHGTVTIDPSTGNLTYLPATNFVGTDTFQYTIADNTGIISAPATITITVIAVPGTPVATDLAYSVNENASLSLAVRATDSNATILTDSTAIAVSPTHGTAVVDGTTGNIFYTPSAGYSGTDTIQYTMTDSLGTVSAPATITITVVPPPAGVGPIVANLQATATTASNGASVNVLAAATDDLGTIAPSGIMITTQPAHGTVAINVTTGAILYLPYAGYVGADSLQYAVSDSASHVSAPATLSLNVGVAFGTTAAKSLTFVDASGSKTLVSIAGPGTGEIDFTGNGTAKTINGAHGTGTLLVAGTGLGINSITLTGTNSHSTLNITRTSASSTAVNSISATSAIGKVAAATSTLSGALSFPAGLATLQAASIANAAINIGSNGSLTLTTGHVASTTLTTSENIKSLKITDWSGGSINASAIASLTTIGNFAANISTGTVGSVKIGGQAGNNTWNISGAVSTILTGSAAPGWTGNFSKSLNSFIVKSGTFNGTLNAASAKSATFAGGLNSATLHFTGSGTSLARLSLSGTVSHSQITSTGSIGTLTMSRGSVFANTNITAPTITSLNLGTITSANSGTPFGIMSGTVGSLFATLTDGTPLRLSRSILTSPTSLNAYIALHKASFGDFKIV